LGQNNIQGGVPSSLGLCRNLLGLDLSQNNLSGTIPKELFSLSNLSILLNLSHNNLNGSFPEEVKILGKLGASDVSNNMLSGEIPGSLGSCVTLEIRCMRENLLSEIAFIFEFFERHSEVRSFSQQFIRPNPKISRAA
jgi:hypothetical protein